MTAHPLKVIKVEVCRVVDCLAMSGKPVPGANEIRHLALRQGNRLSTVSRKRSQLPKSLGVSRSPCLEELAPLAKRAKIENEFVIGIVAIRKNSEFCLSHAENHPIMSIYRQ